MKPHGLFLTEDGSHSIYSNKFEVAYHSKHGAIGETQHVFIDAGLRAKINQQAVSILDIGFGTGLNAFMTFLDSKNSSTNFYYEAIEAYPISEDMATNLNYAHKLDATSEEFMQLHTTAWNQVHHLRYNFTFLKQLAKFEEFQSKHLFDVIYFDAFAPNAQSSLWEENLLAKMYSLLHPDGVLVTYCAQGQFKRNLKAVGFHIEPLPGPPGKREMTRARKVC